MRSSPRPCDPSDPGESAPGTKIGPAENIVAGVPIIEPTEHIAAAERYTRQINAGYLTVMLEGRYTDAFPSLRSSASGQCKR